MEKGEKIIQIVSHSNQLFGLSDAGNLYMLNQQLNFPLKYFWERQWMIPEEEAKVAQE